MDKIINIFTAPTKLFTSLKEKPEWLVPFIIVLVVVAATAVLTINMTKETVMAQQEEILRDQGMTEEQIEQAMQFAGGPATMIIGAIGGAFITAIIMLLFAAIINLLIPVFGGIGAFKNIFSVVCFSALVKVPAGILRIILIAITKSPYVTTSLALFAPNLAKTSFGYQLLSGIDFFMVWEMILVSMGISITSGLKKKSAYILVFLVWIASIFIGIGLGGIFTPR
jgi:hypothetical protein